MKLRIRNYKFKSVFFPWLLSYLLIMVITIIISIFAYGISINIIRNETDKANMESLNQVKQVIDSKISDIQRIGVELSLNKRISSLMSSKMPIDINNRLEMTKIIDDMRIFKIANSFIDELYIYFRFNDFIISNEARYDTKDYYNIYYKNYSIGYSKFETILKDKHPFEYIPLRISPNNQPLKNNVNFIKSLPFNTKDINNATLVIQINEAAIQQTIAGLKWVSQGDIIILDEDNNIVASTKQISLPGSLNYNKLSKVRDIFDSKINNENVVISYSKSDATNWKYISIIPKLIFQKQLKNVYDILAICVLICLLVGGLISFVLTKLNYGPISKLIKSVSNNDTIIKKSGYNEYDFIEKSIEDIISEKDKVYNKLDQQKEELRSNFLSRLIKGKPEVNEFFIDVCESYNIKFNGDYYVAIMFYIEDFSNLYLNEKKTVVNSDEIIDMVYFIMSNIIDTKINEKYNAYMTVVNDKLICLVNLEDKEIYKILDRLVIIITEAMAFIEKRFGIYFSASVSGLHRGVGEIPIAYQETIQAIEYKMIVGSSSIIRFDKINSSKDVKGIESKYIYEEQQFANCIAVGDYKKAKAILSGIFKNHFYEDLSSIQLAKCKMFGLINIIINAISVLSAPSENEFIEDLDLANKLLNCETIFELENKMLYILDKVEEHINDKKKSEISGVINDIIIFIRSNYQDPDLSVSMIAYKFDMGIVNLSKLFKKYSGMGTLDYINKLRIEKAKQITRDENLSVKEIGEKVGYYNSNAFIRVFKKYEGITPGKYKENYHNS